MWERTANKKKMIILRYHACQYGADVGSKNKGSGTMHTGGGEGTGGWSEARTCPHMRASNHSENEYSKAPFVPPGMGQMSVGTKVKGDGDPHVGGPNGIGGWCKEHLCPCVKHHSANRVREL